jgi:hypothetical protein
MGPQKIATSVWGVQAEAFFPAWQCHQRVVWQRQRIGWRPAFS